MKKSSNKSLPRASECAKSISASPKQQKNFHKIDRPQRFANHISTVQNRGPQGNDLNGRKPIIGFFSPIDGRRSTCGFTLKGRKISAPDKKKVPRFLTPEASSARPRSLRSPAPEFRGGISRLFRRKAKKPLGFVDCSRCSGPESSGGGGAPPPPPESERGG